MNLVLVAPTELESDGSVVLTDARARHLLQVLRVAPGSAVRLGVVDHALGHGIVTAIGDQRVCLRCELDAEMPPRSRVDVLLALPRPKVMGRLWAQLAALGVGQVVLTNAARVERCYFDTHVLSPATYHPLLIEGLQQARDIWLPKVSIHRQFRVLVEDRLDELSDANLRLVAQPGGRHSITEMVGAKRDGRVLLAIGPEGGWNDFELSLLDGHGFHTVTLGARLLRSDTACVALLALVHEAIRQRLAAGHNGSKTD